MTLLRWLRETAGRQVPGAWYYRGTVLAFAVLFAFRYIFGFGWLQAIVLGSIVAAALASAAKLIWAAANPLFESDAGGSDEYLSTELSTTEEQLDWDAPPDSGSGAGGAGSRVPRRPSDGPREAGAAAKPPEQAGSV